MILKHAHIHLSNLKLPNFGRGRPHDTCPISKKHTPDDHRIPRHAVNPKILELIAKEHPEVAESQWFARHTVNEYRDKHIRSMLDKERGDMSELEKQVVQAINDNKVLVTNPNEDIADVSSLGARVADMVAKFGGSWAFVISFTTFILIWIIINTLFLVNVEGFDPYPFILLNLALSCIAALQAPIIMMSQNRQAAKDRIRSENEYKINLKAEIEIQNLTHKIDLMLEQHWSHLIEIQELQMNMLTDISNKTVKGRK